MQKRLSICVVSLKRKKKTSSTPPFAGLMSVGSNPKFKWVGLDLKRVIRWVTISFLVARQKTTQKKIRRVKDGIIIAPHKKASAGEGSKEQQWKVEKLEEAFNLWEKNKELPPKQKLSMNKISKMTGIPYTTLNERLTGRRGGGRRGKIVGGKCTAKVLKAGKFKRVTLTYFKWVTFQAVNISFDHLYNTPLPSFLP